MLKAVNGQLHADVHQRRSEERLNGALGDKNAEGVKGELREKTDYLHPRRVLPGGRGGQEVHDR